MNKKLGYSHIYLTEEQYNQVKVSKSFYIPFNFSFHMTHWLIFVHVIIPRFKNRKPVYLEFCKLWSSLEFKAKSEKRRLNCENDPKLRYDVDEHIRKGQRMVRLHV
jgi:hypothetical protein